MAEVNSANGSAVERRAWFTPGQARPRGPRERFGEAWERQTAEPAGAFAAFRIYRDLGDQRSLDAVHASDSVKAARSTLARWAAAWGWPERVRAYDAHLDRRRVEAAAKEVERMTERHISAGMALQAKGLGYVKEHLDGREALKRLTPNTALRFIDLGVQLERQARGVGDGMPEAPSIEVHIDLTLKAALFDRIGQMASNIAAVRSLSPGGAVVEATVAEPEVTDEGEPE